MRAEAGAESPFWDTDGSIVELDDLPLDTDLQAATTGWASHAWEKDDAGVMSQGRVLHAEAAHQLGPEFDLIWADS